MIDLTNAFSLTTVNNLSLFHGTDREHVRNIVSGGFLPSTSEIYLGEGVYFFDGECFSILWKFQRDECLAKPIKTLLGEEDLTEDELNQLLAVFLEKYAVLSVKMDNLNMLDMDNFKHKEMFDIIYEEFYKKSSLESIFETSIYNTMFVKMGLNNMFDGVILTTNLYKLTDNEPFKDYAPQAIIPYRIYCIKKLDKIATVCECSLDEIHIDTSLRLMVLRRIMALKKIRALKRIQASLKIRALRRKQ
ncbi:hypothetical protein [Methanimicrococcus blatticola]|uniref:Uncharacterized protein n=1 Tax=Methanimicrococcus blatticola TaxID=91560 RepID=A0A484F6F1_9EURY|nr:hypothetical protein [Methanimicrococcus blatticola]MBZ3935872.1 hypothetical protein [Methanimicrococcus blatticola]MCC2508007.1 hypothetical protein [Methanimicrococcus blatticola]TDQ68910.1 hypothetical protein C7391_1110 [Methanimicrococcus blatticola]